MNPIRGDLSGQTPYKWRRVLFTACGRACVYCDTALDPSSRWFIDHVIPWDQDDGWTAMDNLVLACQSCNTIAGSKVFDTFWLKRAMIRERRGLPETVMTDELRWRVWHLSPVHLGDVAPARRSTSVMTRSNTVAITSGATAATDQ